MHPITAARVLYFIDPATGTYRGACPSVNGRALDNWEEQLSQFRTRWETSQWEASSQSDRLAAAVDALREHVRQDDRYALGGEQPDGQRAVYEVAGHHYPGPAVLLRRIGTGELTGGRTWHVQPKPAGSPEFWWASEGDFMWVFSGDVLMVSP